LDGKTTKEMKDDQLGRNANAKKILLIMAGIIALAWIALAIFLL